MAIIRDRRTSIERRPADLRIRQPSPPQGAAITTSDGAQILQVRAGSSSTSSSTRTSSTSRSSSTSRTSTTSTSHSTTSTSHSTSSASRSTSTSSSHTSTSTSTTARLPITPGPPNGASTATPSSATGNRSASPSPSHSAIAAASGVHKTPAYVPALATVFSVLGAVLFALLIFLLCRRRRRATLAEVDKVQREKWGVRWRQRALVGSDGGSPPLTGAGAGHRSSSSSSFLSPRDSSLNTATRMLDAPSPSPTGWGPFHITPYRLSFTLRIPSKFKTSKPKSATTGPRELILPSKPRPFYDRRSPPPAGGNTSLLTRPSYRSQPSSYRSLQTNITPPPAYGAPRTGSSRTMATLATLGSTGSSQRSPPTLPPVQTHAVLDIAPQVVESPDPYQPIPSAVLTPLSQIVTFPASNLPLPRTMVVVSTFTPALSDELSIQVGQTLQMVEEYDDGWCLVERPGLNGGQPEQGAVPRFCLEEVPSEEPDTQGSGANSVKSFITFGNHYSGPFRSPNRTHSLKRRKDGRANRI